MTERHLAQLGMSEFDPTGTGLRSALAAHIAYERARARRQLLVHLLAGMCVCLWPLAAWPALLPWVVHWAVLAASALLCIGVGVAAIDEWRWNQRLSGGWTLHPDSGDGRLES